MCNEKNGQNSPCNCKSHGITRRRFVATVSGGLASSRLLSAFPWIPIQHLLLDGSTDGGGTPATGSDLFWIKDIPDDPFPAPGDHHHDGIERLLQTMGQNGLKFYRSSQEGAFNGSDGLIAADDLVLLKVNAQWKYRGCTNSDLIRGLIQRILDHPDGFSGEVVIFENGQGRGSLNCDTSITYTDGTVHANANDESHSFVYLVDTVFNDPRVSYYLLDSIRYTFIASDNHVTDGYRSYGNVSYPCFTTTGGRRVELREGIWTGEGYADNIKLLNVPVLKHHDVGGSEITASLKHTYGMLSMGDGNSPFRHYAGLGETCGRMMSSVRTPVLNILDAVWVSHSSLSGYPASTTTRVNQILAGQDPVALDYWASKYILYPIDNNSRHHPDFEGISTWLTSARDTINSLGGLTDPDGCLKTRWVTSDETKINVFS